MRSIEEALARLGRLESSIAAIEQALTSLRFYLNRLPADDGPAYSNAMKSLFDYEQSLRALQALRDDALWDIDLIKRRDEPGDKRRN
ncbi:hypothetical protein AWB79_00656 [Caballeronia hypogeia]|uniref:Uncharacterized protein n=2 Tax=Caballeronia hypogeia TaxID=1777140 RepID=A0A157ZD00_9BURK|nr:hypothetical protein AWB79_00656 [Caballeronia hypogeia]